MATMEVKMEAAVPDVLRGRIWDPATSTDAQPVNATEAALHSIIDEKLQIRSTTCLSKFLQVFQRAKTEADEALVLIVLRATTTSSDVKLAQACTAAFEKCGGLKITKKWLNEAVEWNYTDLLVLLLEVLKVLPLQLISITEARINEPIVKLRKTAQEDKVRRAAQDLLKHWRSRFTEKEKSKGSGSTAAAPSATTTEAAKSNKSPNVSPTSASSTASASSSPSSSTTVATTATAPRTASEAALKDAKPLKRRQIKRLERMPFGSGLASSSSAAASSTKSSELIGNLLQRKSAKDAAAASSIAKPKKSDSGDSKESVADSKSPTSLSPTHASSPVPSNPKEEEIVMQLPTIQSFNAATSKVSKKIRWADEAGKELVKVKFIESWRDLIHAHAHEESFKDAKLREHADERLAMQSHKDREAFHVVLAHEWSTPPMMLLPESLASRRDVVKTEETEAQTTRTRREMEFLVLDGEVPPQSPKEWARANEPHRGPPIEVPLSDLDSGAPSTASAQPAASFPMGTEAPETEEERALRMELGPLHRNTIALLMENEDVLGQVYDEAHRNGNRISDARVYEIIEQRRRQPPAHHHAPYPHAHAQPGYPPHPPSGYNHYGAGGPAVDYDPARGGYPPPQQPMLHHPGMKRKAPGGGILADAPPPSKRPAKRGANGMPLQCMYFMSPAGCKHGATCQYSHDPNAPPGSEFGHAHGYGPPPGGRFGHAPAPMGMGMRGGHSGMRAMRGGR
ncbi:hypothetical protein P43SY_000843 [Pythium insidiosum]|uniref:Serine/threonine-protein phosphatase 1 regulatory subunit 10 n=1 Tax=Pythium insidiosum TaxID=114742 RepID=A0AAD5Q5V0_PYTIN|nr:hypothetical protein P43SY_000843 [Pythium insidiosum]